MLEHGELDRAVVASGLPGVGNVAWGTHLCHFYRSREELADVLVPFFRVGMENGERCLWITSAPLEAAEARAMLAAIVPDLERRERDGDVAILDHAEWYLRSGTLRGDQLVDQWLEREREALAHGYTGLRVSGNTAWLTPEAFDSFAQYESMVHAAFHGRRILGLCSYSLTACSSDHVIEVLRHHGFALVRREGTWDIVRSATFMLATVATSTDEEPEAGHDAALYDGEDLPAAVIAEFIARGIDEGDAALVLATAAHRAQIRAALASRVDVEAALASRALVELDADEWVDRVAPEPGRLDLAELEAIARQVESARRGDGVHVYGELVDLLCRRGQLADAVALERQWNRLRRRQRFHLLCGYSVESFAAARDGAGSLVDVCQTHARVHKSAARAVSGLRRPRSEAAAEHIALLQRVTGALAEATSLSAVGEVVVADMAIAVGAHKAILALATDDGAALELSAHVGLTPEIVAGFSRFAIDAPLPVATSFRSGQPVWLGDRAAVVAAYPQLDRPGLEAMASFPLSVAGRRLGALGFGFAEPQPFSAPQRALFTDLARQAAFAVDRAVLFQEAQRARDRLQTLYEHAQEERRRAEEANRAKDEFLAMLGHELRNPLSPIVTALSVMQLRDDRTFEKERAVIARQVSHMVRLVDDLLDVSRVTRGKITLRRERLEIAEVVRDAIETVSPLLESRRHVLQTTVPSRGLVVEGDRHRLTQVVANLLTNSAKYTPVGGHVEIVAARDGDHVRLRIRDDGIGIEPELLPGIFELFTQAPRGIDRSQGGLGLGLAIVRSLVTLHGGHVRAESDGADRGTEIVVELPLTTSTAPSSSRGREEAGAGVAPRRKRILVVDDNQDAAMLLVEALRCSGHDAHRAHDGPSALVAAERLRPHIALLDIGLPVMDGHELARRLQLQLDPAPVLVAITGYGLESDRARTAAAGFSEHLVKPIDLSRLSRLVDELGGSAR